MAFNPEHNPYMDIAKTIADNLTDWMEQSPELDTIQKVEAKSGIGFGTVRRAKNGEGNITVEKLEMLAKAFKRHPAEFLISSSIGAGKTDAYAKSAVTILTASEPTPLPVKTTRQRREEEIIELMSSIDDYGLVAILEKCKEIAKTYPAKAPKTERSSN